MITDHPTNVLRLERVFSAAPSVVFDIWTKPDLIAVWEASSHGFRAQDVKVDLRPGGTWSLRNVKGAVTEHVIGTYHEVFPEHRLCYSYRYKDTDFFSVVSIDLQPQDRSTLLHFCQTGFPDENSFVEHGRGWAAVFTMMENALLASHGVGTVWQGPGEKRMDGVARDLEEARRRFEEEQKANKDIQKQ
jgi:uncharacterized protein YndB with AHSA1/START domain